MPYRNSSWGLVERLSIPLELCDEIALHERVSEQRIGAESLLLVQLRWSSRSLNMASAPCEKAHWLLQLLAVSFVSRMAIRGLIQRTVTSTPSPIPLSSFLDLGQLKRGMGTTTARIILSAHSSWSQASASTSVCSVLLDHHCWP